MTCDGSGKTAFPTKDEPSCVSFAQALNLLRSRRLSHRNAWSGERIDRAKAFDPSLPCVGRFDRLIEFLFHSTVAPTEGTSPASDFVTSAGATRPCPAGAG